ncbi:uncharacterized protein LY89DRAFT_734124 [Mollisia scopiformis]|uniref:Uncharacterized protein n=1 Tax=Mollisia scopiformis TaxID=149040 RepID=A0A194XBK0_MOLSC|nr:uncharacterized protein LY89DRAFT_734124 [Mollisia scopiformis]KUJ17137.1 hypothetical protein LY89DRAFT_734124 [Mollisia scopiformis]
MPGVSDVVPAYRLRQEDLEDYLRRTFPEQSYFSIELARDEYNIVIPRLLDRVSPKFQAPV